MAELTCPICREVVEGALCPTCSVPPEAAPAVAAPAPPTREEEEARRRAAREAARADREVPRLPDRLREDHRFVEWIDVLSAEADLFVVEVVATGERRVLKRYRREQPRRPDEALPLAQQERIVRMFREDVDRRRSEIRAVLEQVREVDDAHIITIHDFDVSDDRPWELLEYVGGTLEGLVEERTAASEPFTPDDVREIVEELALALVAIHERRLVHGDIKQANVLVRSRDPLDLVLTDFGGMVKLRTSSYISEDQLRDVPMNVPPELLPAARTAKNDVYQVGGLALQLLRTLAGGGPEGRTAGLDDVLDAVLGGRSNREQRLRWQLLHGALHPDPVERWDSQELLDWALGRDVRDVRRRADPEPTHEPPPTLASSPPSSPPPPTIRDAPPESAFAMARQIAADPEGWRAGRAHLVAGRLQLWADAAMVPLGRALGPGGRLTAIENDDLRLLEVLLEIKPDLSPAFAGWPLTPQGIVDLRRAIDRDEHVDPIGRELLDHLAAPTNTASIAAEAVDRLTRDARPAGEQLRKLISEMDRRRSELADVAGRLGLSAAVEGYHPQLLDEVARRLARNGRGTLERVKVFRRRRGTWSELLSCSPAVRAVLLEALPVATPLQDARRAVGRAFAWRAPSAERLAVDRPRRGRRIAATAVALALAPVLVVAALALLPDPGPRVGPAGPPSPAATAAAGSSALPVPSGPGGGTIGGGPRWQAVHEAYRLGAVALDAFWPIAGHGSVVIAGAQALTAYDASSGQPRWSMEADRFCGAFGADGSRAFRSPVITADTVFVLGGRCAGRRDRVLALDLATGDRRWSLHLARDAAANGMVLADGRLLVTLRGPDTGLVAVDAARGDVLWSLSLDDSGRELLAGPAHGNGAVVLALGGPGVQTAALVTVDAATGRLGAVTRAPEAACGRATSAELITVQGMTVLATADGRVHVGGRPHAGSRGALPNASWLGVGEVWTLTHADLGLPHPIEEDGTCRRAGVAVVDGVLYVTHVVHGTVHAVDLRSRSVLWGSEVLVADPSEPFDVTPLVTRDAVFVVDRFRSSSSRMIRLDRRSGEVLERSVTPAVLPRLAGSDGAVHALGVELLVTFR